MNNVLEKIHKASIKFLTPLSLEQTYKSIAEEGIKLVKADYGSVLREEGGELKRVYASSPLFYQIKPRKRGYSFNVFKFKKPIILSSKSVIKIHPEIKALNIKSDILVPISNRNKTIGVLTFMSKKEDFFTEKDIDTLKLFGQMAIMAIRKAELYEESKTALEARDLFISMAAHEFRTPLTTINGYIQLLYSKLSGANTPESKWVEELSWEGSRLTFLINELLEVERIKTGQFKYVWKECSLKEIIGRALMDFRFAHTEHQAILEDKIVDNKGWVIGDFDKLLQMIINLLDNAAKFSPSSSKIVISIRLRSSTIILSIKDEGQGISKNDLSRIFDRFYIGTGHSREGMGLGLFLAKMIVKQHHGDINIYSKENKGTRVEVKLPAIKI